MTGASLKTRPVSSEDLSDHLDSCYPAVEPGLRDRGESMTLKRSDRNLPDV